jgi:hypothetical protein
MKVLSICSSSRHICMHREHFHWRQIEFYSCCVLTHNANRVMASLDILLLFEKIPTYWWLFSCSMLIHNQVEEGCSFLTNMKQCLDCVCLVYSVFPSIILYLCWQEIVSLYKILSHTLNTIMVILILILNKWNT